MKKRKSAPVLNEIYEERELEEEDVKKESFYHSNFHPSGRHSISTSSPTSHLHRLHPQKGSMTGQVDAPLSKLPPPIFSSRTGELLLIRMRLKLALDCYVINDFMLRRSSPS